MCLGGEMWRRSSGISAAGCFGAGVLRWLGVRNGGIVGKSNFTEQFLGLVGRDGRVGSGLGVVQRAACLVVCPVIVGGCASLFGCVVAARASGSVAASSGFDRWVGLGGVSLAWPAVVRLLVFIYSGVQWSWHECSSLFVVVIGLFFVFSCFGAFTGLGTFVRAGFFVCFCILGGVGTRGGVGWLWECFGLPGGLLCWPFRSGGPGVGLAVFCFVVCSAGRFVSCLALCRFDLVFFGPFGVAVASLGEVWGGFGAFRAFVRFVLVWVFLLVCGKGCGLWLWHSLYLPPNMARVLVYSSADSPEAVDGICDQRRVLSDCTFAWVDLNLR